MISDVLINCVSKIATHSLFPHTLKASVISPSIGSRWWSTCLSYAVFVTDKKYLFRTTTVDVQISSYTTPVTVVPPVAEDAAGGFLAGLSACLSS